MTTSSRSKAYQWPYPRHRWFEETLRQAASSWFKARGFSVDGRYPFILADRANWPQNLIVPEVSAYIEKGSEQAAAAGRRYPLHKYIHHGLSSQAMLFNLIGPLIVRNDLSTLRTAFALESISALEGAFSASFEYEDRCVFNEDYG